MLSQSAIHRVIEVLKKSLKRSLKLRLPGYLNPYYVSFLVRDIERFHVSASAGSVFELEKQPKRIVFCDLRVGNYKNDQTLGLPKTDEEEESLIKKYSILPLEDSNLYAFETCLWRLSELCYRDALKRYQEKQAKKVFSPENERFKLASFTKLPPAKFFKVKKFSAVNQSFWKDFVKKISKLLINLPKITFDYVSFSVEREIKIFVNTERRVIVQSLEVCSLFFEMFTQTWDGSNVKQEFSLNVGDLQEVPNFRDIKEIIEEKYAKLKKLASARRLYSFSGPTLLLGGPAGLLFHETLGHRLEGDRLLEEGEINALRGLIGKKILPLDITIIDNPKLKKLNGQTCVGSYDFDDQGVPSQSTTLFEDGVLKGFLTSRAQCYFKNFKPNGHARSSDTHHPMSRMGVLVVKAKKTHSLEKLKEMLVREIVKQGKPYGMIIEETIDGETRTDAYNPQVFSGKVNYAKLVYPDGNEEVIRGLNFVGTPLQSLSQIIAVGDKLELDNSFCVAESGTVPVTTISPAILLKNFELQTIEDTPVAPPFLLPKPKIKA